MNRAQKIEKLAQATLERSPEEYAALKEVFDSALKAANRYKFPSRTSKPDGVAPRRGPVSKYTPQQLKQNQYDASRIYTMKISQSLSDLRAEPWLVERIFEAHQGQCVVCGYFVPRNRFSLILRPLDTIVNETGTTVGDLTGQSTLTAEMVELWHQGCRSDHEFAASPECEFWTGLPENAIQWFKEQEEVQEVTDVNA